MYNYYYQYEANSKNFFTGLKLGRGYEDSAITAALIFGFIALALILVAAIFIKRARVLGIIAAVMQPIGTFAAAKAVIEYGNIDFSSLNISVTASSQSAAMDKLMEKLNKALFEDVLPQTLIYMLWCMVLTAALVITLIYCIMLFKARVKVLAIFAMICTIIKFVMGPVNVIAILLNNANTESQGAWDVMFRILFLIPAILIGIQGFVNMRSKEEPAPVAVAPIEVAAAETAPAEEAPIEAAPAAENLESKNL